MAWKLLFRMQATTESGRQCMQTGTGPVLARWPYLVNMKSSNIMTLFSEQPRPRTGPSAFVVSLMVHLIAGAVFLAVKRTPRMSDPEAAAHLTVRLLKAQRIELTARRPASSEGEENPEPIQHASARETAPGSGGSASPALAHLPQLSQQSQTLVQPDPPSEQMLAPETPVPLVVLLSPENTTSKVIVAPPQQEPTIAEMRPALIKPNREPKLSDVNITTTPFPSQTPLLPPGSTSPVVVRGQQEIKQIPSTSAEQLEPPAPAQVLSLSPLRAEGAVVIPFANRASQPGAAEQLTASTSKASGQGNGSSITGQGGTGTGSGAGPGSVKGLGASASGTGTGVQRGGSAAGQNAEDPPVGLLAGSEPTVTRLTMPKDGQFGVVVVGSTLSEEYPEIVGIWGNRLVYTVYLRVGLRKNWIMQYSLPQTEEALAAGNTSRPQAPWPFDILRPKLNPADYNADAIMVHGFVNPGGRFERLALVFPAGFPEAKFVLNTLQQWVFRPARQNGHDAAVEVLLIIPEEAE